MTRLPEARRPQVGEIRTTALTDRPLPLGHDTLRGIEANDHGAILRDRHGNPGTWRSGLNGRGIETGGRTLLVGAGVAGRTGAGTRRVMANFRAAGFAPTDVDTVFVSPMLLRAAYADRIRVLRLRHAVGLGANGA